MATVWRRRNANSAAGKKVRRKADKEKKEKGTERKTCTPMQAHDSVAVQGDCGLMHPARLCFF